MKSKKGAIQTLETIAVLFVVFIILIFAFVFLIGYSKSKADSDLIDQHHSKAIRLAKTVSNLPELRKTQKEVAGVNTFDILKLTALSNQLNSSMELRKGIYQERFANSRISIHKIYPENQTWNIYDNHQDSRLEIPFFIPISLFDPLDIPGGNFSMGLLEIVYYGE